MGKNKSDRVSEGPNYTDEELSAFTVHHRRAELIASKIGTIVISLIFVAGVLIAIKNEDTDLLGICVINLVIWPVFAVIAFLQDNQRLDVKNEILTYTNIWGKSKEAKSYEIRYIEVSYIGSEANLYVYNMDNVRLFKVNTSMTNYDKLSEYLSKREYHMEIRRRSFFKHLSR